MMLDPMDEFLSVGGGGGSRLEAPLLQCLCTLPTTCLTLESQLARCASMSFSPELLDGRDTIRDIVAAAQKTEALAAVAQSYFACPNVEVLLVDDLQMLTAVSRTLSSWWPEVVCIGGRIRGLWSSLDDETASEAEGNFRKAVRSVLQFFGTLLTAFKNTSKCADPFSTAGREAERPPSCGCTGLEAAQLLTYITSDATDSTTLLYALQLLGAVQRIDRRPFDFSVSAQAAPSFPSSVMSAIAESLIPALAPLPDMWHCEVDSRARDLGTTLAERDSVGVDSDERRDVLPVDLSKARLQLSGGDAAVVASVTSSLEEQLSTMIARLRRPQGDAVQANDDHQLQATWVRCALTCLMSIPRESAAVLLRVPSINSWVRSVHATGRLALASIREFAEVTGAAQPSAQLLNVMAIANDVMSFLVLQEIDRLEHVLGGARQTVRTGGSVLHSVMQLIGDVRWFDPASHSELRTFAPFAAMLHVVSRIHSVEGRTRESLLSLALETVSERPRLPTNAILGVVFSTITNTNTNNNRAFAGHQSTDSSALQQRVMEDGLVDVCAKVLLIHLAEMLSVLLDAKRLCSDGKSTNEKAKETEDGLLQWREWSAIHVMEMMRYLVATSQHHTTNPVTFLLSPMGELHLELGRTLLQFISASEDRTPRGAAAALSLLAACVHHNVRDVAPALLERSICETLTTILTSPLVVSGSGAPPTTSAALPTLATPVHPPLTRMACAPLIQALSVHEQGRADMARLFQPRRRAPQQRPRSVTEDESDASSPGGEPLLPLLPPPASEVWSCVLDVPECDRAAADAASTSQAREAAGRVRIPKRFAAHCTKEYFALLRDLDQTSSRRPQSNGIVHNLLEPVADRLRRVTEVIASWTSESVSQSTAIVAVLEQFADSMRGLPLALPPNHRSLMMMRQSNNQLAAAPEVDILSRSEIPHAITGLMDAVVKRYFDDGGCVPHVTLDSLAPMLCSFNEEQFAKAFATVSVPLKGLVEESDSVRAARTASPLVSCSWASDGVCRFLMAAVRFAMELPDTRFRSHFTQARELLLSQLHELSMHLTDSVGIEALRGLPLEFCQTIAQSLSQLSGGRPSARMFRHGVFGSHVTGAAGMPAVVDKSLHSILSHCNAFLVSSIPPHSIGTIDEATVQQHLHVALTHLKRAMSVMGVAGPQGSQLQAPLHVVTAIMERLGCISERFCRMIATDVKPTTVLSSLDALFDENAAFHMLTSSSSRHPESTHHVILAMLECLFAIVAPVASRGRSGTRQDDVNHTRDIIAIFFRCFGDRGLFSISILETVSQLMGSVCRAELFQAGGSSPSIRSRRDPPRGGLVWEGRPHHHPPQREEEAPVMHRDEALTSMPFADDIAFTYESSPLSRDSYLRTNIFDFIAKLLGPYVMWSHPAALYGLPAGRHNFQQQPPVSLHQGPNRSRDGMRRCIAQVLFAAHGVPSSRCQLFGWVGALAASPANLCRYFPVLDCVSIVLGQRGQCGFRKALAVGSGLPEAMLRSVTAVCEAAQHIGSALDAGADLVDPAALNDKLSVTIAAATSSWHFLKSLSHAMPPPRSPDRQSSAFMMSSDVRRCEHFEQGFCWNGDACGFAHSDVPLPHRSGISRDELESIEQLASQLRANRAFEGLKSTMGPLHRDMMGAHHPSVPMEMPVFLLPTGATMLSTTLVRQSAMPAVMNWLKWLVDQRQANEGRDEERPVTSAAAAAPDAAVDRVYERLLSAAFSGAVVYAAQLLMADGDVNKTMIRGVLPCEALPTISKLLPAASEAIDRPKVCEAVAQLMRYAIEDGNASDALVYRGFLKCADSSIEMDRRSEFSMKLPQPLFEELRARFPGPHHLDSVAASTQQHQSPHAATETPQLRSAETHGSSVPAAPAAALLPSTILTPSAQLLRACEYVLHTALFLHDASHLGSKFAVSASRVFEALVKMVETSSDERLSRHTLGQGSSRCVLWIVPVAEFPRLPAEVVRTQRTIVRRAVRTLVELAHQPQCGGVPADLFAAVVSEVSALPHVMSAAFSPAPVPEKDVPVFVRACQLPTDVLKKTRMWELLGSVAHRSPTHAVAAWAASLVSLRRQSPHGTASTAASGVGSCLRLLASMEGILKKHGSRHRVLDALNPHIPQILELVDSVCHSSSAQGVGDVDDATSQAVVNLLLALNHVEESEPLIAFPTDPEAQRAAVDIADEETLLDLHVQMGGDDGARVEADGEGADNDAESEDDEDEDEVGVEADDEGLHAPQGVDAQQGVEPIDDDDDSEDMASTESDDEQAQAAAEHDATFDFADDVDDGEDDEADDGPMTDEYGMYGMSSRRIIIRSANADGSVHHIPVPRSLRQREMVHQLLMRHAGEMGDDFQLIAHELLTERSQGGGRGSGGAALGRRTASMFGAEETASILELSAAQHHQIISLERSSRLTTGGAGSAEGPSLVLPDDSDDRRTTLRPIRDAPPEHEPWRPPPPFRAAMAAPLPPRPQTTAGEAEEEEGSPTSNQHQQALSSDNLIMQLFGAHSTRTPSNHRPLVSSQSPDPSSVSTRTFAFLRNGTVDAGENRTLHSEELLPEEGSLSVAQGVAGDEPHRIEGASPEVRFRPPHGAAEPTFAYGRDRGLHNVTRDLGERNLQHMQPQPQIPQPLPTAVAQPVRPTDVSGMGVDTGVSLEPPFPWDGVLDPMMLSSLPDEVRAEVIREHLPRLTVPFEHPGGPSGEPTHLHPAFLGQLPEEIQLEAIMIEVSMSATGEGLSQPPPPGANANVEVSETLLLLAAIDDEETRRDILTTCQLADLVQNPAVHAEAVQLRERQRRELEERNAERQREQERRRAEQEAAMQRRREEEIANRMHRDMMRHLHHGDMPPFLGRGGGGGGGRPSTFQMALAMRERVMRGRPTARTEHEQQPPQHPASLADLKSPVPLRTALSLTCFLHAGCEAQIGRLIVRAMDGSSNDQVLHGIHQMIDMGTHPLDEVRALTANRLSMPRLRGGISEGAGRVLRPGEAPPPIFTAKVLQLLAYVLARSRAAVLALITLPSRDASRCWTAADVEGSELELEQHPPHVSPLSRLIALLTDRRFSSDTHSIVETILGRAHECMLSLEKEPDPPRPNGTPAPAVNGLARRHPRHEHPLVYRHVKSIPRRAGVALGYSCDICKSKSIEFTARCDACGFDLCPGCFLDRNAPADHCTLTDHWARTFVTRLLDVEGVIRYLQAPECKESTAVSVTTIMARGLRLCGADGDSGCVYSDNGESCVKDPLAITKDAVCTTAKNLMAGIRAAIRRAEVLETAILQSPAMNEGNASRPRSQHSLSSAAGRIVAAMELPAECINFVGLLLLPFAEAVRGVLPVEVRMMWHAVKLYLAKLSAVTSTMPNRLHTPLPPAVHGMLNGFVQFHLLLAGQADSTQCRSSSFSAGIERTETELLLSDRRTETSAVSDTAVAVATAERRRRPEDQRRHLFREPSPEQPEAQPPVVLPPDILRFCEANRNLINTVLHWDPSLLQTSFSFLHRAPRLVDLDFKLTTFRANLNRLRSNSSNQISLHLPRQAVFVESFKALKDVTGGASLHVRFRDEEGSDAGGLTREWFQLMSEEMVNDNYALFVHSSEGMTYQPNPCSGVNATHLDYFRFCGVVVGLSVFNQVPLDVHFTRSVYRHMIGVDPCFRDVESIDPTLFRNLEKLLTMDITPEMSLDFTVSAEKFGKTEEVELIPGGADIPVTNENKKEYIRLRSAFIMTGQIEEQLRAFLTGFYQIIPRTDVQLFTEQELELVISGMPDIDVEDLRLNTEYSGYSANSPVIRWFWEIVAAMTRQDRANLLQFATGSSKVPHGGFSNLESGGSRHRFSIQRIDCPTELLPVAHTCFNRIDLPPYPDADTLREKLMIAVTYGNKGFSMV